MTRLAFIAGIAALIGAAMLLLRGPAPEAPPPEEAEMADAAEFRLDLPAHRRPVILEVETGPLPRGAELVLETPEGVFVGSISPFPPGAEAQATRHQIVVTREDLPGGPIVVVGRILLDGAMRTATADELRSILIVTE